jgi:hypothetical protein
MLRFGQLAPGTTQVMYIGTSIFLIAVGAILKFAVTAEAAGIDLQTAGVILMIVGGIGLLVSLLVMTVWADRRRQHEAVADPDYRPPRDSGHPAAR